MIPQSEVELLGEDLETFEKLYSVLEDDERTSKRSTQMSMDSNKKKRTDLLAVRFFIFEIRL